MAADGGSAGLGLIAGILIVVLIGVGVFIATDGFNFKGSKDANVNELPKALVGGEKNVP